MATKKTNSAKPELNQGIEPGFISARAALATTPMMSGKPDDDDMSLINRLSRTGRVDPDGVYRFDCIPSTQMVDSYYTRMDTTSLVNYADEAKSGIPVLNSHRSGGRSGIAELPIGRSFNGLVENDPDNPKMQRFRASAYMLRNNMANGSVNTNEIINAIEAGTVSDISIGFAFSAGTPEKNFEDRTILRCSICGQDFLRSDPWGDDPDDCPHWPGEVYKTNGGKNQELCVLDVVNAHLSEFSTVYNGATPGAVILKAQRAAQEGALDRGMVHKLEDMYRCRLVDYSTFQVPIIGARKEKTEVTDVTSSTGGVMTLSQDITENPIAIEITNERNNDEMADKRELEDASKEGAKLALANLAKSIMGSRNFNEEELALFPEIETRLAAGELDRANILLTRLMVAPLGEEDENGNIRLTGIAGTEGWRVEDQELPEGNQGDIDNPAPLAQPAEIVRFGLDANERQQFQVLKERNIILERDNKRLAPLAAVGERYRSVLIEQTIRQAVRAEMGSETDTLDMLQHLPIEHIERIYSQYKQLGDTRLGQHDQDEHGNLILTGIGGRQTTPANPNQPNYAQALNTAAQRAGIVKRNDLGAYR
jgi:hypothetical protein